MPRGACSVYARNLNTTPAYPGHIPLNWFENAFLAVGSAVMSLADPRRGGEQKSCETEATISENDHLLFVDR